MGLARLMAEECTGNPALLAKVFVVDLARAIRDALATHADWGAGLGLLADAFALLDGLPL